MFKVSLKTGAEAKPLQLIAVSDIGVFAAKAFEKPEEYNTKALALAGADITFEQAKESTFPTSDHLDFYLLVC